MNERFDRFFYLTSSLYTEGSPVIIESGALLKDKETRAIIGQVKLKSITNKVIKFARIKINYFDSLGRPVGESQSFEYLDLAVSRDESFGAKKPIRIPDSTSRSFAVTVTEVGFVDNSFWSNTDGVWEPLPEQRKIAERFSSRYASKGYRARFGTEAKYEVLSAGDIWLCCCGGINHKSEKRCLHCNASYDELILPLNEEELERDGIYATACAMAESMDVATVEAAIENLGEIKDYKDAESLIEKCEARVAALKNAEAEAVAHKKKRSKLNALISGGVVALVLIGYFLIYPLVSLATGNYKIYIDMFNVEEFEVPDGETCIDPYEFAYCDSLKSIVIPDSVTSIGDDAFRECTSLASVVIGDSVTSIGDDAFSFCDGLTSIEIPDSVTTIGYEAFSDCDGLTSIEIPDSVTTIGDGAFSSCDSLTSVTIGSGVTSIGEDAFYYCDSLTSIVIPDSVTSIGDDAFAWCTSLTSVTIGSGVTSIGDYFSSCDSLTSVTIGNGVTSIGEDAFRWCDSLTSIVIPDSVKSIGEDAFSDCDSLTSIVIPDSVTSIGDHAFSFCYSLTSIKYRGTETQWKAITKGYGWDYNTSNYTITYNYTGK